MRAFIEQITSMDSGQLLAWAGLVSLIGFGLWAAMECIRAAVELYAAYEGRREDGK